MGAAKLYFALRRNGNKTVRQPGFRRKTSYAGLRDFDGYGFKVAGDRLTLGLGLNREDGVRHKDFHHRLANPGRDQQSKNQGKRKAFGVSQGAFKPAGRLVPECLTRGIAALYLQPKERFLPHQLSPDQGIRAQQ